MYNNNNNNKRKHVWNDDEKPVEMFVGWDWEPGLQSFCTLQVQHSWDNLVSNNFCTLELQ